MDNPLDDAGIVDSRDVVRYTQEKESELAVMKEDLDRWENEGGDGKPDMTELEALEEEVEKLTRFCDEGETTSCDWAYGESLIPEADFEDWVKEFVENVGDLPRDLASYIAIDWAETADNLRADFSEIEYEGTIYLVRCS